MASKGVGKTAGEAAIRVALAPMAGAPMAGAPHKSVGVGRKVGGALKGLGGRDPRLMG